MAYTKRLYRINKLLTTLVAILVAFTTLNQTKVVKAATFTKTKTFYVTSYTPNATSSIHLPRGVSITNIQTDNGQVDNFSFDTSNQIATVNVKDGATSQQWNSNLYSKYVSTSKTSSSSLFADYTNYTEDGYSGTLYKSGTAYVISGSYIPEENKIVSEVLNNSTGIFNPTIIYNSGGFSGILSRTGNVIDNSTIISGSYTPEQTKTVSETQSNETGIFNSTIPYNSGGFSGSLSKSGSMTSEKILVSGSLEPASSKSVTDSKFAVSEALLPFAIPYNSDGFSGTLVLDKTEKVQTGIKKELYEKDKVRIENGCWHEYFWRYDPNTNWTSNWTRFERHYVRQYHYLRASGYEDTTYKYRPSYEPNYKVQVPIPDDKEPGDDVMLLKEYYDAWVSQYAYKDVPVYSYLGTYKGTALKPSSDTRVYKTTYKQNYSGTVIKPEVDTRIWNRSYAQNYSGMVTKPGIDTRTWQQNYSGTIYKGGYENVYKYAITVTYEEDVLQLDLTPSTIEWTNQDVSINAVATSYYFDRIVLPNGTSVRNRNANYTATTNGMYTFRAYDPTGFYTEKSISITNIDKVNPSGSFSTSPSNWNNQNLNVLFDPYDFTSGVKQWRYRISSDNGVSWGEWSSYILGDTTASITLTALMDKNIDYKIQAEVIDNATNIALITSETYKFDKILPSGTFSPGFKIWNNSSNLSVLFTPYDNGSGVKQWRYRTSTDKGATWGRWSSYYTGSYYISLNAPLGSNTEFKIQCDVTDYANNVGTVESGLYQFDRLNPTGIFSPDPTTEIINNITFDPVDSGSGVNRWRYRVSTDNGLTWLAWSSYVYGDTTSDIELSVEGKIKIQAEVTDNSGNVGLVTSGSYQVFLISINATVTPGIAKQGEMLTFDITTAYSPDKLIITIPDEVAKYDKNLIDKKIEVTIPKQNKPLNTKVEYFLSLEVPLTLDEDGKRLFNKYIFPIRAMRTSDGRYIDTFVEVDVQNNIFKGLRTRMR